MQIITIAGNIGKDAETRTTNGGDKITSFSVAVSEGRDKPTTWWDCSIWGQRGERVAQYLAKGSKITVSGRFGTREYEGKTYLQCNVNDFALQGGKPSQGGARNDDYQRPQQSKESFELDDEIPF